MIKKTLAGLAIVLWAVLLLVALWWYNSNYIRTEFFSGQQLHFPASVSSPAPIRLVHFWEPGCPCNLGNQQHLADLMHNYKGKVAFYHMQMPGSSGQLPKSLDGMQAISLQLDADTLPASPAVAIFDEFDRLAYFGPYSEGAICTSSNSFVEPILDALLEGRSVLAGSNLAAGCFCSWQHGSSAREDH